MRRITVSDGRRVIASAEVSSPRHHRLLADIHLEAGHLPTQVRPQLVDALMSVAITDRTEHIDVVMPMGDGALLAEFRRRCHAVETRPTGSTCLLSADLDTGADTGGMAVPATSAPPVPLEVSVSIVG